MAKPVVPIAQMAQRMPTQGRIRIGKKVQTRTGKMAPSKIDAFRFTSHDQVAIHEIAARYGGEPRPWADGPRTGEWEVETRATEIPIALPPDPLGGTPIYELWSGGGCTRRCDGEVATVPVQTRDGAEHQEVACLCAAAGALTCKPKTRLSVILREIRFGGIWRLDSGGEIVAAEMPGMVAFIQEMQGRGVTKGVLTLREMSSGKNKWMVPALGVTENVEELIAGASRMGSLAPAPVRELTAADFEDQAVDPDFDPESVQTQVNTEAAAAVTQQDLEAAIYGNQLEPDIEDAEIVEFPGAPAPGEGATGESGDARRRSPQPQQTKLVLLINDLAAQHGLDGDELRHAAVRTFTNGTKTSSKDLTVEERSGLIDILNEVANGTRVFAGLGADGVLRLPRVGG